MFDVQKLSISSTTTYLNLNFNIKIGFKYIKSVFLLTKTALHCCIWTADCHVVLQMSIWHYQHFQCSYSNPESQYDIRNIIKILLVRICWILYIFQGFKTTLTKYSYFINMHSGQQCPVSHHWRAQAKYSSETVLYLQKFIRSKGIWCLFIYLFIHLFLL